MAIKHIPHGKGFFDSEHAGDHAAFGFKGSIDHNTSSPPFAKNSDNSGTKRAAEPVDHYSHGGMADRHPHGHAIVSEEMRADGGKICHHAHGGMTVFHADGHVTHHHHDGAPAEAHAMGGMQTHMHPDGHQVMRVEHHANGNVIHHHIHGGHTVHHKDGRITHHHEDGAPAAGSGARMRGIENMHDESEFVHRARGGSISEEKGLIKKAFRQHENAEHDGQHEDLHLARGGSAMLPRGMKPMAARHHSPISLPKNPQMTTSPRDAMAGGDMGYGVEPSAEPDVAGSEQGIPQMSHGGRHRRGRV